MGTKWMMNSIEIDQKLKKKGARENKNKEKQ